jgi:hypothetical protein
VPFCRVVTVIYGEVPGAPPVFVRDVVFEFNHYVMYFVKKTFFINYFFNAPLLFFDIIYPIKKRICPKKCLKYG